MPSLNYLCSWVPGSRFASPGMTACVIVLAAGGREGAVDHGSKSKNEGRGTPKRLILYFIMEPFGVPPAVELAPVSRVQVPKEPGTFGGFGSPRPRTPPSAHRLP